MNIKLIGGVVAAGLLAMMVAKGTQVSSEHREGLIEKHQLGEMAVVFMETCASDMRSASLEFSRGADEIDGCACVAGQLTKDMGRQDPLTYFKTASETYAAILKGINSSRPEHQLSALAPGIAKTNKVSVTKVMKSADQMAAVMNSCTIGDGLSLAQKRKQREVELCSNRGQDYNAKMHEFAAKRDRIYDEKTCSNRPKSGS